MAVPANVVEVEESGFSPDTMAQWSVSGEDVVSAPKNLAHFPDCSGAHSQLWRYV